MIPTPQEIATLWDTYALPEYKRNHSRLVANLTVWFAKTLMQKDPSVRVDLRLLEAAALLHDIDKMAPKRNGERHPDTGVRLLREHGLNEIADLVRTHPLHAILDQNTAPNTREEKLLYLSDKMVKHAVGTVDERFALWRAENLPEAAIHTLDCAYPLVKNLEQEVCTRLGIQPGMVAHLVNAGQ